MKKPVNMREVALASAALAAAVAPKKPEAPMQGAAPTAASVGNDGQSVVLVFDKPVDFTAMTPEAAVEMAQHLVGNAIALNPAIGNTVFNPVEAERAEPATH